MSTVLIVDDKEMMRDSVAATLQRAGHEVVAASDATGALAAVVRRRPDAVITDLRMPGLSGLDLLARLKELDDELPVVVMTAFGTVETAVAAMKGGAYDFVPKPFDGDHLILTVRRAIEHARVVRENAVLRRGGAGASGGTGMSGVQGGGGPTGIDRIVGDSPAIRRVKEQVLAVASSSGTVLICGESGTGKEVVARAVHELSPRATGAFLAVNCAALSESLLESELFGHEKGAFTGAEKLRKGRFELADMGTLLLDEISEMSVRVQAKLLRVLQERVIERVGSSLSIGVDVRVVATSNRDLPRAAARQEFRQDLFFRLNVLPIHLPPLRDRIEDVPPLAHHFVSQIAGREGQCSRRLGDSAIAALRAYAWPGNVRELQNICERAVVLSHGRGDEIGGELIEPWLRSGASELPETTGLAPTSVIGQRLGGNVEPKAPAAGGGDGFVSVVGRELEDIEREAIVKTLTRFDGHRQRTAAALGIGVRTLGLKLKRWKNQKLVEPGL